MDKLQDEVKLNITIYPTLKTEQIVFVYKFQVLAVILLSRRERERQRARISLKFLRCPRRYNPLVRGKLSLTTSCSFARSHLPSYVLFIARQVIESAYFQK